VTEWHQFRSLDVVRIKDSLRSPYFFDLRNIYDKQQLLSLGYQYYGVGL
jgi:UDPglucose 6-dehydrogenase